MPGAHCRRLLPLPMQSTADGGASIDSGLGSSVSGATFITAGSLGEHAEPIGKGGGH